MSIFKQLRLLRGLLRVAYPCFIDDERAKDLRELGQLFTLLENGDLVGGVEQARFLPSADMETTITFGDCQRAHVIRGEDEIRERLGLVLVDTLVVDEDDFLGDPVADASHRLGLVASAAHGHLIDVDQQLAFEHTVETTVDFFGEERRDRIGAEQWLQDLVDQHALAGAFGAVQQPCGLGHLALLEDVAEPVHQADH